MYLESNGSRNEASTLRANMLQRRTRVWPVERAFSYGSFYALQVSTKSNSQPLRIVGIFVSQFEEWTMRGIIGLFSILLTANLQAAENFLGPTELASLKPHPTVEGMTRHSYD